MTGPIGMRRQVYRAPTTTSQPGVQGDPGSSAYQVWLQQGHSGSAAEFLEWLRGVDGTDGVDGVDGTDGIDGVDGKDSTVAGPVSTTPGPASTVPGPPGDSAYQVWLKAGHTGTEAQFLASLRGAAGADSTVPGPPPPTAWGDAGLTASLLGGAERTLTVTLGKAMPSTSYAVLPSVLGWGMSIKSAVPASPTTVTVVVKNMLLTAILAGEASVRVVAIG